MSGADDTDTPETWLAWSQRLRAIAQTGLAYSRDGYDLDRFRELGRIAEAMLARISDVPPAAISRLYLPERGYPTPKVEVRAGVFRDDTVLLVREEADGRWSLPGGWADEHGSPRENVEREVLEESGYRVRAVKLVAVKDRALHDYIPQRLERIYKLHFLCELVGGTPATSLETTAIGFFPLDRLPELSVGRVLADDIRVLDAHRQRPELPTYFD